MSEPTREPVQPTLRRLRRFDIHPDHDLGQSFLVDSNILGVIERAAELSREDVVLEIGGGLGALSEHLAQRVAHVHVIEVDERLREALSDATDPHANVEVHWGDAMKLDLGALEPAPTKLVANLPYGIAAGVLLRTIEELASIGSWVAMVQREVGERLAAAPGGGAYGAPSVIAQLHCEVRVAAGGPAHGLSPGAERRLGARRDAPARGRRRERDRLPRAASCARWSRAPSRIGERRSPARWRCRIARAITRASACALRCQSSAIPPMRAPSAWRPRTLQSSRGCCRHELDLLAGAAARARERAREGEPRAVRRAAARRRQARARDRHAVDLARR